jgi:hypothetical protein
MKGHVEMQLQNRDIITGIINGLHICPMDVSKDMVMFILIRETMAAIAVTMDTNACAHQIVQNAQAAHS